MSAETPGTHRDTEALAELICVNKAQCGSHSYDSRWTCTGRAKAVLASDWLAAYVARRVEVERAETRRWREMWDKHGKNDLLARVAQAERERDEARAVIERVTALLNEAALSPRHVNGYSYVRARDLIAALGPAAEPASDRPLTLDEHLAEIERRIELRACITGTDRHLDILHAYREEVRRA